MVSYARMDGSAESPNSAEALAWWDEAIEQLDGMTLNGIMISYDQRILDFLHAEAGNQ